MSNETQEMEMGTKPVQEHEWLQQLVGEWRTKAEMTMPDGSTANSEGTESVTNLGGLWAFAEGKAQMPDGNGMVYKAGFGYDVSFKEYRAFWLADMSSHLWKSTGTMSEDKKTLTLDCVGPHMEKDGETANYRDVHELIDANHRRMTSFGQDDDGNWNQFMKVEFTRA
jgi:hypothetical protein